MPRLRSVPMSQKRGGRTWRRPRLRVFICVSIALTLACSDPKREPVDRRAHGEQPQNGGSDASPSDDGRVPSVSELDASNERGAASDAAIDVATVNEAGDAAPRPDATAKAALCDGGLPTSDLNGRVGQWRVDTLTPSLSMEDSRDAAAISLEPGGAVHVVADNLYGTNRSGQWVVEPLPGGLEPRLGTLGLALSRGRVHVSRASDGGIDYAVRANEGWTRHTVDADPAIGQALALTHGEQPNIVYWADGGLRLASFRSGAWNVTPLEPSSQIPSKFNARNVAAEAALDTVRVAYSVPEGQRCSVKYGVATDGAWTSTIIADAANCGTVALALSPDGAPYVAFALERELRLMQFEDDEWSRRAIPMDAPFGGDIAVDHLGQVHFVIGAAGLSGYWRLPRGEATELEAMPGAAWGNFGGMAIALGSDDIAHVAFVDFDFVNYAQLFHGTYREVVSDGVDANCDGVDGIDNDGDGIASVWSGGTDCDDDLPNTDDDPSCSIGVE